MEIPLIADVTKQIAKDYGVLIEGAGVALRYASHVGIFFCPPPNSQGIIHY